MQERTRRQDTAKRPEHRPSSRSRCDSLVVKGGVQAGMLPAGPSSSACKGRATGCPSADRSMRLISTSACSVAEGVGFEPTRGLRPCRFSRPVQSTTLPPFRGGTVPPRGLGGANPSMDGGWSPRRPWRGSSSSRRLPKTWMPFRSFRTTLSTVLCGRGRSGRRTGSRRSAVIQTKLRTSSPLDEPQQPRELRAWREGQSR